MKKLQRRPESGRIAGVCAGIGEYMDADVTLVRLGWVVLSIIPGTIVGGFVAYIAAWILMPEATEPAVAQDPSRRWLTRSLSDRKLGGVCGGIGENFQVDSTVVRVVWVILGIVPGCFVFGLLSYLVAWFIVPEARGVTSQAAPSAA